MCILTNNSLLKATFQAFGNDFGEGELGETITEITSVQHSKNVHSS